MLIERLVYHFDLRLHTNGSINTNDFTVHHGICNDRFDHHGEFVGFAQALRKWYRFGKESLNFLRQLFQQWCSEQSRSNSANSDTLLRITNQLLKK